VLDILEVQLILENRLVDHLVTNNTNEHLQNAIVKYGLDNFTFAVVEFCDLKVLLQREQHYPKEIFFFFFSLTDPGVPLIKKRSTGPGGPDYLNLRLSKLFLIVRVLDSL
jgi:hypothetical protein